MTEADDLTPVPAAVSSSEYDEVFRVTADEIVKNGLQATRMEVIAQRTSISKRMLYYYFGDKQGLYDATVQWAYLKICPPIDEIDLSDLTPTEALRKCAIAIVNHVHANRTAVALVALESIQPRQRPDYSSDLKQSRAPLILTLEKIMLAGQDSGLFRPDVSGTDMYVIAAALAHYRTNNRNSFHTLFGLDLLNPAYDQMFNNLVGDTMVALATTQSDLTMGLANPVRDAILGIFVDQDGTTALAETDIDQGFGSFYEEIDGDPTP